MTSTDKQAPSVTGLSFGMIPTSILKFLNSILAGATKLLQAQMMWTHLEPGREPTALQCLGNLGPDPVGPNSIVTAAEEAVD